MALMHQDNVSVEAGDVVLLCTGFAKMTTAG
jgi:hypothetical protein